MIPHIFNDHSEMLFCHFSAYRDRLCWSSKATLEKSSSSGSMKADMSHFCHFEETTNWMTVCEIHTRDCSIKAENVLTTKLLWLIGRKRTMTQTMWDNLKEAWGGEFFFFFLQKQCHTDEFIKCYIKYTQFLHTDQKFEHTFSFK